jgi:hypothetical protein
MKPLYHKIIHLHWLIMVNIAIENNPFIVDLPIVLNGDIP